MLVPSLAARSSWVMLDLKQYSLRDLESSGRSSAKGGESHLTALITRRQKGCRNDRIRSLMSDDNLSQKGNELGFVAFGYLGHYFVSFWNGLYPIYAIIRG